MENTKTVNQEINVILAKIELIKKENEMLKKEILEKEDLITDLKFNMKKVDFVLSEWFAEYSFSEEPDPRAALKYTCAIPSERQDDNKGECSAKWYWDYDRIKHLMEIANEYIFNSMKLIKGLAESEN